MVRWGDGEVKIILGGSISYQDYTPELADSLYRVLTGDNDRVLIASPNRYVSASVLQLLKKGKLRIWLRGRAFFIRHRRRLINSVDAFGFRKESQFRYLPLLKELCNRYQRVIFIGANLHAAELLRDRLDFRGECELISTPKKNTFQFLPEIEKKLAAYTGENCLVLCACGPASKILVEKLSQDKFQCVDIGHLFDHLAEMPEEF